MRPQLISIICVLGIFGAVASVVATIWSNAYTLEYRLWMFVMAGIQLKAIQGIWNMKKWGVVLYAVKLVLVQFGMMVAGFWSPIDLMFPVLIMLALSQYYNEMR